MQRLINTDISPACEYCYLGRLSSDNCSVLCSRNGVMSPSSSCRHFKYDPLKRHPKRTPKLREYSKEEFEL
ncbi:MAG: hypothetical protein RR911_04220 [Oscillospiraceae bacterium]